MTRVLNHPPSPNIPHPALKPIQDAEGCTVHFTPNGYTISSSSPIEKGEELYISYGNHSNDFLLTEYGFILPSNVWDEISLDPFILPLLYAKQKETLKEAGFLGKYVLDSKTVCYRTQVALRLLCVPERRWTGFLKGFDDEEKDQAAADVILGKVSFFIFIWKTALADFRFAGHKVTLRACG